MKRNLFLLFVVTIILAFGITADSFAKDLKIGFADKLQILFEYKKAKELNEALEKENQAAKEEFDKKTEMIKKLRDEMELLKPEARKKKETELEEKLKELDDFRREKQREIGRKYDEGIREISKEIASVCEKYGKDNGYDVIIDSRATVYVPNTLDVTIDIIKELNK